MTTMDTIKYACVFPGQGSQSVGMMDAMFVADAEVDATFALASEVLGQDMKKLVTKGPAEELDATVNTQPVMLTASVALWRVWCRHQKTPPTWMCGHSVGEYAALVCAGALAFEDALPLVRRRAELMQQAVGERETAMVAVLGVDDEVLGGACIAASGDDSVVEPVNYNAKGQTVVAGHKEAIERLTKDIAEAGKGKCIRLPVSVPAHSSLMNDAAIKYTEVLEGVALSQPQIPVIHNIDARSHVGEAETREALAKQINHPVRWAETMRYLLEEGLVACLEVGPGKVLNGLNRRIDKKIKNYSLNTSEDLITAKAELA